MKTWIMLLASIFLGSVGQLLIKYGLNGSRTEGLASAAYIYTAILNPHVAAGLLSYGLSMIFWFLALRQAPLSLLYPMVSLSYIFVAAGSAVFLGETLSPMRILGIGVIIVGVVLVART
ncbi:MAG: Permease of the drug/metabolite transporter (DMT) superfamily [Firmicutes bacterium]|nr:Permease of the drug/metabolite transporter (DMT) superfamily [Bacillota bacterium]MDI6705760.1 EamA family transporter [Bacillota bacterium]